MKSSVKFEQDSASALTCGSQTRRCWTACQPDNLWPSNPGKWPNGRRMRCTGRAGSGGTHLGVLQLVVAPSYRRLSLAISSLAVWLSDGATTLSRSGLVHDHPGPDCPDYRGQQGPGDRRALADELGALQASSPYLRLALSVRVMGG